MNRIILSIIVCLLCPFISLNAQQLAWAKQYGSSGNDSGNAITTDLQGNVYTTGTYEGNVDFDNGPGTLILPGDSISNNVFVMKSDPAGNLLWAKPLSGPGQEVTASIHADDDGNIYLTGLFSDSIDMDPGPGEEWLIEKDGRGNNFLAKYNTDGELLWARHAARRSTTGEARLSYLTIDANQNIFVAAAFDGPIDFDPGPGTEFEVALEEEDVYMIKYDRDGNFLWVKTIRGNSTQYVSHITNDTSGNIYLTGVFREDADFDPGPDTLRLFASGEIDGYLLKLDNDGEFIMVRHFPGNESVYLTASEVDWEGNIYLTGYFDGSVDLDPDTSDLIVETKGARDAFVVKLDHGGSLVWSATIDGLSDQRAFAMDVDPDPESSGVYMIGDFEGDTDFDPGTGEHLLSSVNNSHDIFILNLDPNGDFRWVVPLGGEWWESSGALHFRPELPHGELYSTGWFNEEIDFDPGMDSLILEGDWDIFMLKLSTLITSVQNVIPEKVEITLMPNPTSGELYIESKSPISGLALYDAGGNKIKDFKILDSVSQLRVNVSGIIPGLYYLRFLIEGKSAVKKVVIIK